MCVPSRTFCLTLKEVVNGEFVFFGQKETGAERVTMATAVRESFCFFCAAHFQEHCFNIARDIVYSVFYHF